MPQKRLTENVSAKKKSFRKYFFQYSTFAPRRPQIRTRGRQTCFLPRAPSNRSWSRWKCPSLTLHSTLRRACFCLAVCSNFARKMKCLFVSTQRRKKIGASRKTFRIQETWTCRPLKAEFVCLNSPHQLRGQCANLTGEARLGKLFLSPDLCRFPSPWPAACRSIAYELVVSWWRNSDQCKKSIERGPVNVLHSHQWWI